MWHILHSLYHVTYFTFFDHVTYFTFFVSRDIFYILCTTWHILHSLYHVTYFTDFVLHVTIPYFQGVADIFAEDCDITIECLLGGEGMMVCIWCRYFCRRLWYYDWVLAWGGEGTMVRIWCWYICWRLWYNDWVLAWGRRNDGTYMVLIYLLKTVILQLSACLGEKEWWYVYGADIFAEDCDITTECLLGGEGMMVRIWCWYICWRLWYYDWVHAWGRRNDGTYMVLIYLLKTVI